MLTTSLNSGDWRTNFHFAMLFIDTLTQSLLPPTHVYDKHLPRNRRASSPIRKFILPRLALSKTSGSKWCEVNGGWLPGHQFGQAFPDGRAGLKRGPTIARHAIQPIVGW